MATEARVNYELYSVNGKFVTSAEYIRYQDQETVKQAITRALDNAGLPKMKAKVGQVLSVKAVDEEGYPTEYEWISLKEMFFTQDMDVFRTADGEPFITKE